LSLHLQFFVPGLTHFLELLLVASTAPTVAAPAAPARIAAVLPDMTPPEDGAAAPAFFLFFVVCWPSGTVELP
jgi:hypothetical protein